MDVVVRIFKSGPLQSKPAKRTGNDWRCKCKASRMYDKGDVIQVA